MADLYAFSNFLSIIFSGFSFLDLGRKLYALGRIVMYYV